MLIENRIFRENNFFVVIVFKIGVIKVIRVIFLLSYRKLDSCCVLIFFIIKLFFYCFGRGMVLWWLVMMCFSVLDYR